MNEHAESGLSSSVPEILISMLRMISRNWWW